MFTGDICYCEAPSDIPGCRMRGHLLGQHTGAPGERSVADEASPPLREPQTNSTGKSCTDPQGEPGSRLAGSQVRRPMGTATWGPVAWYIQAHRGFWSCDFMPRRSAKALCTLIRAQPFQGEAAAEIPQGREWGRGQPVDG